MSWKCALFLSFAFVGVPHSARAQTEQEQKLAQAQAAYAADSTSADNIVWLGRRIAYTGRYRDAIDVFTRGITLHPNDARFYRHRGHRYITLREFDNAIRDLEHAATLIRDKPDEIEPDGQPNKYNIPVSTLHTNIFYHLALAHYLKHDFERALPVWRQAVKASTNDDMLVASSDWLYMTLRRLGRKKEAEEVLAPIRNDMKIIENDVYHRRLLMYKGELKPEDLMGAGEDPVQVATYGYGVGNWYLYNGERDKALEIFRKVLQGSNKAAFGFIAAEMEIAR